MMGPQRAQRIVLTEMGDWGTVGFGEIGRNHLTR
jgi:hypothetical protein